MKVLNCYAGIGGNRKLWKDVEVTAIELNPKIASIYKKFFPEDTVLVTDAHQYLLEHYNDGWDFIWSSPPCPSHSVMRQRTCVKRGQNKPIYPDMKLYEEIIFLRYNRSGPWCIENVNSYYKPLIKPQEIGHHYLWANFKINKKLLNVKYNNLIEDGTAKDFEEYLGMSIPKRNHGLGKRKDQVLHNCIHPEFGLHIFNCAFKLKQQTLGVNK